MNPPQRLTVRSIRSIEKKRIKSAGLGVESGEERQHQEVLLISSLYVLGELIIA